MPGTQRGPIKPGDCFYPDRMQTQSVCGEGGENIECQFLKLILTIVRTSTDVCFSLFKRLHRRTKTFFINCEGRKKLS